MQTVKSALAGNIPTKQLAPSKANHPHDPARSLLPYARSTSRYQLRARPYLAGGSHRDGFANGCMQQHTAASLASLRAIDCYAAWSHAGHAPRATTTGHCAGATCRSCDISRHIHPVDSWRSGLGRPPSTVLCRSGGTVSRPIRTVRDARFG